MKLFGSKHKSNRAGKGAGCSAGPAGKSPRKSRLNGTQRGLLILLGSILVLSGMVFGIYKASVKPPPVTKPETTSSGNKATHKVSWIDDETGEEIELDVDIPGSHKEGYFNILIVGTDDDGTRTDTIMIARMDNTDHTVALMSIPRDTLISASYSVPKINSVYGMNGKGEKGITALRKQLTSILGFDVDGYVMVDLEAFVQTVNLIGGVSFDVPQRMYYNDPTQNLYIDLQKGEQTLNGKQAMGLVRFRSYAEGDIKRTEVQQNFMKAVAKQCLKIGNLTKIKPMIDIFAEYVDTDLTLGNMAYFAQELLKCNFEDMKTYTLPGCGGVMIHGGDHYALFPSKVLEIVNESFNPYDTDIPLGNLHIRTASSGSSAGSSSSGNTQKPSGSSGSSTSSGASTGTDVTAPPDNPDVVTPPDETQTPPPDTPELPETPIPPTEPNGGTNGADVLDPAAGGTPEPTTPPTDGDASQGATPPQTPAIPPAQTPVTP